MKFIIDYAPLRPWQVDVLSIIREEAYYFSPQAQTKIMNEGWASYWHSTIMTRQGLEPADVVNYADHHSGTMASSPTRLNPYKLGIELLRDIEDRWNKGRFGKEYDECDDMRERRNWDTNAGLGRQKIFEVRRIYNDLMFIDEFLTHDFCRQHKLFSFNYQSDTDTYNIESREFPKIKERLLYSLTNIGQPARGDRRLLRDGGRGVPASIIGWPDQAAERNIAEIAIPKLGSLYLTHSWDGAVKGLKDFPADQRPPVAIVYFSFRIMVGIALLMLAMVVTGLFLLWRRRLDDTAWYLKACQFTVCLGFIAVLAGWTVTEVGRQPWTIYGLMRTAQSVSPSLTGPDVLWSLLGYMAVYLLMFPSGIAVMVRMVRQGPDEQAMPEIPVEGLRAAGPLHCRGGVTRMGGGLLDLVPIWTAIIALGVFLYVAARRFRSRRGHALGLAPERSARW